MASTLTDLLNAKLNQVTQCEDSWLKLKGMVFDLLTQDEADDRQNIETSFQKMQQTVQVFNREVKNPRITLATTGTTSGGKSSLVNLLCGADIMPTAVQEMSIGTVVIDHDQAVRWLQIPLVDGVAPGLSGEWQGLDDAAIKSRLTAFMEACMQRQPRPAPRISIKFPTRLGLNPELAGLPKGFRLRILDLPGLKYIEDQSNREVIHNEVKPALCLVTYNSEETDSNKQKVLLEEVVDQVREIRGSPARMLFVLNRIDVFRRDENWQSRTQSFIEKTMANVRSSIKASLREYGDEADQLRGQPLSTGPALYAHLARTGSKEIATRALEQVERTFGSLMPKEIKDLPRSISKWDAHSFKMIADEVWRASFAADFDELLRVHIHNNLPQLLLPHLLTSVADTGGECLTVTEQIAHAHVHSHKEKYEKECARLAAINEDLHKIRIVSEQELLKMITVSDDGDVIGKLTDKAKKLAERYKLAKDSLVPFYDWSNQLGKAIDSFLSAVLKAIQSNSDPTGLLFDLLLPTQKTLLTTAIKRLETSGYQPYLARGGLIEARTQSDKNRLRAINEALNALGDALSLTLKSALDRIAEQEADRIQNALQTLIVGYAADFTNKAKTVASDLTSLSVLPSSVIRIDQQLVLPLMLGGGFLVHSDDEQIQVGTEQVLDHYERVWWTLWIKERAVYRDQPVYETRTFDQAVIPSSTQLISDFQSKAKVAARDRGAFIGWLRNQLNNFLHDIKSYQEEQLKQYREHLDLVRGREKDLTDQEVAIWEERSKQSQICAQNCWNCTRCSDMPKPGKRLIDEMASQLYGEYEANGKRGAIDLTIRFLARKEGIDMNVVDSLLKSYGISVSSQANAENDRIILRLLELPNQ